MRAAVAASLAQRTAEWLEFVAYFADRKKVRACTEPQVPKEQLCDLPAAAVRRALGLLIFFSSPVSDFSFSVS